MFTDEAIRQLAERVWKNAVAKGFWDDVPRNRGEMICLMHSELSEALEAVRTVTPDGTPLKDKHCPQFSSEVIELADCVIRIMDYTAGFGLPLGEAILAKMAYNETRPPKHGRKF